MSSEPSQAYLDTLCLYYEEEIMGEGYFNALADQMPVGAGERRKLRLLAEVERCAARSIEPLLKKHAIQPRKDEVLWNEGRQSVERDAARSWHEFMAYIVERYPAYLEEFAELEAMAPSEDLPEIGILTAHEVAAIEFARLELAGDSSSTEPLVTYLGTEG